MRPGQVVDAWGDDANGYACVLATSRHKRKCSAEEAAALLASECEGNERVMGEISVTTWRSHTKAYLDEHGCHCQDENPDGSAWCADGDGRAWVRVLCVDAPYLNEGSDK